MVIKKFGLVTSVDSPTQRSTVQDIVFGEGNAWIGYTFGALFILLGISMLFVYPKTKRISNEYRERQMESWKNNNPKSKIDDYNKTGLYLPMLERVKSTWPIFIGMTFIFVGVAWIAGNTLTVL